MLKPSLGISNHISGYSLVFWFENIPFLAQKRKGFKSLNLKPFSFRSNFIFYKLISKSLYWNSL